MYTYITERSDCMAMQTIELNGTQITFDKEKTKLHRTSYNEPCDCQDCRNYYQYVAGNRELVAFLDSFGVDYHCDEEVMSFDLGDDADSQIHHVAYYAVFGMIEKEIKFEYDQFGVDITFEKAATGPYDITAINTDREEPYFWIIVKDTVPYILDEERDMPETFFQKLKKSKFMRILKSFFAPKRGDHEI